MAKVVNMAGMMISGKVGNLVYCNGGSRRTYVRALGSYKDEPTVAQLTTRMRMKLASHFLAPFRQLIAFAWSADRWQKKNPFDLAMSHMLLYAFRGTYPDVSIDYSQVLLSKGKLKNPDGIKVIREAGSVKISWEPGPYNVLPHVNAEDDEVVVVIHSESEVSSLIFRGRAIRRDGFAEIHIPPAFANNVLHVFMFLFSHNGRYASDTQYLGRTDKV